MKKRILTFALLMLTVFGLVGCANSTPFIGENGNWWVGDTDLGVPATGPQGEQGEQGPQGEAGEGVTVTSVEKTDTNGNVDTYTITYSDGTKTTFTVTNGENGSSVSVTDVSITSSEGDVDTYTIYFSDGTTASFTVTNGKDLTVISIEKVGSDNLCDTYRINYSNGTYSEFIVTNGATPYIGENGNWWIDGVDTGVMADSTKEDKRDISIAQKIMSSGLEYELKTVDGHYGYFVTNYDTLMDVGDYYLYADEISYQDYIDLGDEIESRTSYLDIVVPNYIGNIPVIGIGDNAFNDNDYLGKISLSNNTTYLGQNAFYSCNNLSSVDFNNSNVKSLGNGCFYNDHNLTDVIFPESLTFVGDKSLYNCSLKSFNFTNVKYIGEQAFVGLRQNVYLTENVEYVGSNAFLGGYLFIEHNEIPSNWGTNINGPDNDNYFTKVVTGCHKNNEFIYSIKDNKVTLHSYLGVEKKLRLPETVDGLTVEAVGYGFNSYCYDGNAEIEDIINIPNGFLSEIIIPSTYKRIEEGSLLCTGSFIYVEDGVEEVWIGAGFDIDIDIKLGVNIYENPSKIAFKIENETWSFDDVLSNEETGFRTYSGISFEDIFYDESTKTYFVKESGSYTALACLDFFASTIEVPNTINNLPVTQLDKFSYCTLSASKYIIGDNVKKIRSYAFGQYNIELYDEMVYVYIPGTVDIINQEAFFFDSVKYLIGASSKPEDWDSDWADGETNIVYNCTRKDIDDIHIFGKFEYTVDGNNITLIKCYGTTSTNTIKIPREIDGKIVTKISSGFFIRRSSNDLNIYIPESVIVIEENAFMNEYYSYFNFHFEASEKPDTISNNYCYNSNYGSYTQYKREYFNVSLGY